MFENFIPSSGFVLAKVVKQEQKTDSGLFLTAPTNNNIESAIFIRASSFTDTLGCQSKETHPFNQGDTIYYKKYIGTMLDDELIVLKKEDVLGIVR